MKRITKTTLLVAGISIATPAFLVAQGMATPTPPTSESTTHKSKSDKTHTYGSTSQITGVGTAQFQRISKDALERQATAKDVIGKAVYGSDGNKLGDISDLTVSADFQAAQMAKSAKSSSSSESIASTSTPRASTPGVAAPGAASAARDTWSSAKAMTAGNESHAIISAGGVLGMGENLVSVPVSALRYDSEEEHFILNVTKDQFLSFAEESDDAARPETTP